MNRTDRLLAIVLELQGRGRARAEDLAETFETSKRTIYRDIQALGQAGVPLVSTPGRGYSLMEGYFLPPLSFTVDEATILLLGSEVMAQSFDAQYRAAAESASRKIAGVLPERQREQVRALQGSLRFIGSGLQDRPEIHAKLQQLRRAILECRRVRFRYQARQSRYDAHPATEREADPYGLIHANDAWYVTGYCHLRHDVRSFRLERIDDLAVLEATFTRPANFTIHQEGIKDTGQVVRALFDPAVARWVQEAPSFYTVAQEATPEGWLVTLRVRQERDVLQWLLGWGRHVRVLEPASLQRLIVEEAEALLRTHQHA
jgi:predicted DNA-binding transcriptional regulator YafY